MTPPPNKPSLKLDKRTYRRALDCVHCGLCLPACPTYGHNGLEPDSPRGRIHLIKALADNRITPTHAALHHLDLCLDCRACETACPSGVVYHELIHDTRALLADKSRPALSARLVRFLTLRVFPYPHRLKALLLPVRLLQKARLWDLSSRLSRFLLPAPLAKMHQMLPPGPAPLWPKPPRPLNPAKGRRKASVALFAGCINAVLLEKTNRRTIALLNHLNMEVMVPKRQACCGAIHHHAGDLAQARQLARQNIAAFDAFDLVVTNIAGCGAMLKDYHLLLRDDMTWGPRAKNFVAKVKDVTQFLAELDLPAPAHPVPLKITYHDSCHHAHAQQLTAAPRKLLRQIQGLQIVEMAESDTCCGAAGTYNLLQPAMAHSLADRKLANIAATGCTTCLAANVGCILQIQAHARAASLPLQVLHPVDLLYWAHVGKQT